MLGQSQTCLVSQWRPDPPEPDLEALDMAVIQAECQGTSNMSVMTVHHAFMYMYTCIIIIIYLFFFSIFFSCHQPQNDVPIAMHYQVFRGCTESVWVCLGHIFTGLASSVSKR